jgi:hypothetical protein
MKNIFTPRFLFVAGAVAIAAISRVFPHIDNFTPIAAMALFGAASMNDKKLAFLVPMIAMLISDILLELITGWGFHNTLIYVYVSFILTSLIGLQIKKNPGVLTIGAASLISSVLFFLITNFGYWAANGFVGGAAGLSAAYIGGLPFFAPTLVGDLFYNSILFGALYLAQRRYPVLIRA